MLHLPHRYLELDGPALDVAQRVVIVIHGMSSTALALKAGYPAPPNGSITKPYWHLPILRDGLPTVQERRREDVFRQLFAPVIDQARQELTAIIERMEDRPVGLFGFSIGGLIALWGALDNSRVTALVTVGGVSSLNYLPYYYPDYPWSDAAIQRQLTTYDVLPHAARLHDAALLICHGQRDDVAQWRWMQPLADQLQHSQSLARVQQFSHLQHRLWAQEPNEERDLQALREMADAWFVQHIATRT